MKKELAAKIADARGVLQSARATLMDKARVLATGVGFKHTGGKPTDEVAIVCSVAAKAKLSTLRAADVVPPTIDGIRTDVHVTGPLRALQAPTERFRPAPGGVSVGHFQITAGTIFQVDVTASVEYGAGKTATFVDQLMADGMSAGGDSGAAILNERNEIVGLLFAGSANTTIINRIDNVFSLLQLSLSHWSGRERMSSGGSSAPWIL